MRLKHVRRRGWRRVRQGLWGKQELHRMADRKLLDTAGIRRGTRSILARCYPELFIALQHKYPWPRISPDLEWDRWETHSKMLDRRMANLRKIHKAYGRKR